MEFIRSLENCEPPSHASRSRAYLIPDALEILAAQLNVLNKTVDDIEKVLEYTGEVEQRAIIRNELKTALGRLRSR